MKPCESWAPTSPSFPCKSPSHLSIALTVRELKSTRQPAGLEALMGEKSHPLMDLYPGGQNIYAASSEKHFYSW